MDELDKLAVENFRKYLRIPSVPPQNNYDLCVQFLEQQAQSLSLPIFVINVRPDKPVVIIQWKGTNPEIPSILLNSHMDVVPVEEDKWIHPPFEAHMDEKGDIYGRGTQDMKSVGVQYLEAIRRLKKDNVQLKRTINVCFVPDEEVGGREGMKLFVQTDFFKKLNVEFALDESGPSPLENTFIVNYAEKHKWSVEITCKGAVGHGSAVPKDTAAEKLGKVLRYLYEFREEQSNLIDDDHFINLGKIVTLNATIIKGGQQENVIPSEFTVRVDIRIPPKTNIDNFRKFLQDICAKSGKDVTLEEIQCEAIDVPTSIDDSNIFWTTAQKVLNDLGYKVLPVICAGISDSRYLRNIGIKALGLSLITETEFLLHAHNEYLNKKIFLKGIDIYCKLLPALANL